MNSPIFCSGAGTRTRRVAAAFLKVLGSEKLNRLLVPTTVITLFADVVAATVPPQAVAIVTTAFLGVIVPDGTPEAVTLTLLIPATPLSGEVQTFRCTAGGAANADPATTRQSTMAPVFAANGMAFRSTALIPPKERR